MYTGIALLVCSNLKYHSEKSLILHSSVRLPGMATFPARRPVERLRSLLALPIAIVAKASKANGSGVISRLQTLYGG